MNYGTIQCKLFLFMYIMFAVQHPKLHDGREQLRQYNVFKNGPSKNSGRQPLKNLKTI